MLDLAKLREITFVKPEGTAALSPSEMLAAVAARARHLSERFPPEAPVGIIHRTSPELVIDWLAALTARLVPTILQYPTAKQNRASWANSVNALVRDCRLAGLLVEDRLGAAGLAAECPVVGYSTAPRVGAACPEIITGGEIIQMSSGTTGQRKPIAYSLQQIAEHVACYNDMMRMGADDVVVSWLPLYHDMGFIACFIMPMLVGARLVLIDPIDWVSDPGLLYTAIDRCGGTICYMPNFGFEVMARRAQPARLPSMRKWISCAEPISLPTVRRFLAATGTEESRFGGCYAMAENVFAVAQSDGLEVAEVDGRSMVSCGRAIRAADIKILDGEIWVRSPSSIKAYLYGEPIVDEAGFYPTGDIGQLSENGLVILGRKRDVLIQAGTKYFLSDLDAMVNDQFPEVRGRGCALAVWDDREGTEHPLLLIERQRFFDDAALARMTNALRAGGNLAHFEMAFVPRFFVAKTSSGKINRPETLRQWQAVQQAKLGQGSREIAGLEADIARYFATVPQDFPVGELLDSLGMTVLRMILADYGRQYDPLASLSAIRAGAETAATSGDADADLVPCVKIVSCADGRHWSWMGQDDLSRLEELLGCPVHFEHICAPPVPALLSDLIFYEYFLPGRTSPELAGVASLLGKIRSASALLFDDIAELGFGTGIFPVLNHRFERDPAADLLCYRWQRYTARHDALPITLADLSGLDGETRAEGFRLLGEYLRVPLFRIAVLESHQAMTQDWEYREIIPGNTLDRQQSASPAQLRAQLFAFLERHARTLPRTLGPRESSFTNTDLPHFCCAFIDQAKLDAVLEAYDSFAVIGPPQCVPYIRTRATRLGKPVNYLSSWNVNSLEGQLPLDGLQETCVLITGAWGLFEATSKPVFQVMLAYPEPLQDNLAPEFVHLRHSFSGRPVAPVAQSYYRYWS